MNPSRLALPGLPLPLGSAWVPTAGTVHCALETAGGSRDYLSPFICLPSRKDRCLLLREKKKKLLLFTCIYL